MLSAVYNRLISRLRRQRASRNCVLERLPKRSIGAEIGVYKGEFSRLILRSVEPSCLHLIDPWRFESDPTYARSWYGGPTGQSQKNMDAIYRSICNQLASSIASGQVVIHRGNSADVLPSFEDRYFDWIYIDGNHQYEFVKADLELSFAKVKVGGLVTGDDYANPGWWNDGVTRAVDEALAGGSYNKVLIEDHQFILRKSNVVSSLLPRSD